MRFSDAPVRVGVYANNIPYIEYIDDFGYPSWENLELNIKEEGFTSANEACKMGEDFLRELARKFRKLSEMPDPYSYEANNEANGNNRMDFDHLLDYDEDEDDDFYDDED